MPAVFDDRHVHIHNIAFFKRLVIRYAVAHLVIDGRTKRLWVRPIALRLVAQRGGYGLLHLGHVDMRQAVNLVGGQAGFDERGQVVQHFRSQFARHPHAFNACCVFVGNRHRVIIPPPKQPCWQR